MGALNAVTIDAAYSLKLEKEIGSIVTGKLANFTAPEDNPPSCDPMEIKNIEAWGTVHEFRLLPVDCQLNEQAKYQPVDAEVTELARIRMLNAAQLQQLESQDKSIGGLLNLASVSNSEVQQSARM
ncbi:MAG: amidohydrolase family protein [Rubripirellula sp.]|nr:amidohydrolase family protein [Rubripirellula sp.]